MGKHPVRSRLPWPLGWSRARKNSYFLRYLGRCAAEGFRKGFRKNEEARMAREHDDHRNENHSDHMTNDDAESNGSAGTTSPQDSHEGE